MNEVQTRMFEQNVGLVYWVAHRQCCVSFKVLPADEREQAARIGLWKAVERYDPKRGALSTFARRVMLHEIQTVLGTHRRLFRPSLVRHEVEECHETQLRSTIPGPEDRLIQTEETPRWEAVRRAAGRLRRRGSSTRTPQAVVELLEGGLNQTDVARRLGVSKQWIQQVCKAIRMKLAEQETDDEQAA